MAVVVRSTSANSAGGSSRNIPFPAGAQDGDFCVIFFYSAYGSGTPAGWTDIIAEPNNPNVFFTVRTKVLDSSDIALGYVTFTSVGSGAGTWSVVCFEGHNILIRDPAASNYVGVSNNGNNNLISNANVQAGDLCFLFGANTNWSDETFTAPAGATQLQFFPSSVGASCCLYSYVPSADGAFTSTHHSLWGGTQSNAIIAVTEPEPPGPGIRAQDGGYGDGPQFVAFPVVSEVGDRAVVMFGGDYGADNLPGWLRIADSGPKPNWNGGAITKVLTAQDLTDGGITLESSSGIGSLTYTIAIMIGAPYVRLPTASFGSATGATEWPLAYSGPLTITDLLLFYGSNRADSMNTVDVGDIIRQEPSAGGVAASSILNSEQVTELGSVTATFSFSVAGAGFFVCTIPLTFNPTTQNRSQVMMGTF